jgi:EAL domain-containing protein (putative c-di-GMP-specific phosphodiesterase class I)
MAYESVRSAVTALANGAVPSSEAVRAALANPGGEIHLQPVIRLSTHEVVGYEALSRFHDGTPEIWFQKAWEIGVGIEFEIAAVRRALRLLPCIPEGVFLGINVSPRTLVSNALQRVLSREDGHRLVLELTEHEAISDYTRHRDQIARLRRLGARLAIDDVGAGHSSLVHIIQLRPDVIKIDRALVAGCDLDPVRRVLMQGFVTLARHTQAHLVAEGVETSAEAQGLIESGVAFAQGYLFGRPQPHSLAVPHERPSARAVSAGAAWPPPFAK